MYSLTRGVVRSAGVARMVSAGRSSSVGLVRCSARTVPQTVVRRAASAEAAAGAAPLEKYNLAARVLHWVAGGGMIVCVGTVMVAQDAEKGDPIKGKMMHLHKSVALIVAGATLLRVGVRLATRIPPPPPGPALEQLGGHLAHAALYGFSIFMPVSGIIMGYYGGKGLPFFGAHIAGKEKPDGATAKQAFQLHKLVGYWGKFLIPLHVGALGYHMARGQNLLRRII